MLVLFFSFVSLKQTKIEINMNWLYCKIRWLCVLHVPKADIYFRINEVKFVIQF